MGMDKVQEREAALPGNIKDISGNIVAQPIIEKILMTLHQISQYFPVKNEKILQDEKWLSKIPA